MKLLIALMLLGVNQVSSANPRLALAVGKHAACSLSIQKWSGAGRIADEFEVEMRKCRAMAYQHFDWVTENEEDKQRLERLFTVIEVEALQQFRK